VRLKYEPASEPLHILLLLGILLHVIGVLARAAVERCAVVPRRARI